MAVTMENGIDKKSLADRESANRTLDTEIEAISRLRDSVALSNLTQALDLMQNAPGRIIVTGMGKSGHIGNKIAASLASTGSPSFFVHPAEASHGDLGMITEDDVVIAISNSGESKELVDIFCDPGENHSMRMDAGYTLNAIASEDARKMCKRILTDQTCSTDFKGILFQMTWPHYISIQEIWPHIHNYDNTNMDSLWTWINVDFPRSLIELSEDNVFETLLFLIDNVELDLNI